MFTYIYIYIYILFSLTDVADINGVLMQFQGLNTQKQTQTVTGQLLRGLGDRKGNTFHPTCEQMSKQYFGIQYVKTVANMSQTIQTSFEHDSTIFKSVSNVSQTVSNQLQTHFTTI